MGQRYDEVSQSIRLSHFLAMPNRAPHILLIHGLGRSPLSLINLEWQLKRRGCRTELFGYMPFVDTFAAIAHRLHDRLQQLATIGNYGVVAHSLGGLLARSALSLQPIAPPEHLVMLGTPNQPPRLAPHAWQLPPFRWFTGNCGFSLTSPEFYQCLPKLHVPYTIIAGTSGPRGPFSPFGDDMNDGIVAVKETHLRQDEQVIELPVEHTFMMNDRHVQKQIFQALQLSH
jgi:pimeloyl-ACP methyl ester carboxylesterase